MFGSDELFSAASAISEAASITPEIRREEDISCVIKAKIVSHLLTLAGNRANLLGSDPELDEFMETYCDMLVKFKSDLSRPFDEATTF
ncbi:Detected protein of confused Function [Hibiscus syriacus]|uniref:Detected protein of confused Function n=1 Tax=Hibiscus syriacus TaxID=106335 RepID=A0A6A2Z9F1_HIBSY|nr:Detected protein of confused Function [Hibiscus syriacus]